LIVVFTDFTITATAAVTVIIATIAVAVVAIAVTAYPLNIVLTVKIIANNWQ
jgi:hypothetical protein